MPLVPSFALLIRSSTDGDAVRAAQRRGTLMRLTAGRYVRMTHWNLLTDSQRFVLRTLAAVSCLKTNVVVSHASAGAHWGLPRLGRWPARAQVIVPEAATSTANSASYKHAGPLPDSDIIDVGEFRVTSPARTAADLVVTVPFRQAVVSLDAGLRRELFTRGEVLSLIDARPSRRGAARACRAIAFADPRSASVGESLSRLVMFESSLPAPELQHCFPNASGPDAIVDFFWPELGVVGEFDGEVKYRDHGMRNGRSPEQVVIDEKNRENWILRQPGVRRVVRWDWSEALAPGCLPSILADAGVRAPSRRESDF